MKISILIPSYQRTSDLKRCLAAIALQTRSADEVLVIAREGDAETLELVTAFRQTMTALQVIHVGQPGLIAALNRGFEKATGDVLVFTDDDAEAQPDWLQRIEANFAAPDLGAVGGRDWLQLPQEPSRYSPAEVTQVGVLTWYGKLQGNHHCPLRGHKKKAMFLKGVNMAYRRTALGAYRVDTALRGVGAQAGTELDLCSHVLSEKFNVLFDDQVLVKHYTAPRPKDDVRTDMTGSVWKDVCFNTHYLIAKHYPIHRSLVHFCYGRLFGSRYLPGLLSCLKWTAKGDWGIWKRLLQMTSVAAIGFRTGRKVWTADKSVPDFSPLNQQDPAAT